MQCQTKFKPLFRNGDAFDSWHDTFFFVFVPGWIQWTTIGMLIQQLFTTTTFYR